MGSQFVDLNADGHLDYLTATFDGSPHVAWGSAKGFGTPERLKDTAGRRLVISSIWNYETKKHENVGWAMPDGEARKERCISALAFDWDGDDDYDLLLGSYENGHLYRVVNVGSKSEPKFEGTLIPVTAGGKPFAIGAKMTAPQLIDWDGDGDLDLLAGSFGDSYQDGPGGGVYLARNLGKPGAPEFGALETIIPPSAKGAAAPTRPDAGCYAHAADVDGDGDIDLVVGGYSMWTPAARELTAEEQAEVVRLRAAQSTHNGKQSEIYKRINAEVNAALTEAGITDIKSAEARKLRSTIFQKHSALTKELRLRGTALQKQLDALVPRRQRDSFVWFYERR